MCIAVDRQSVRPHGDDLVQRSAESLEGLQRQPIDQIEVDRLKAQIASGLIDVLYLFPRLHAIHRHLHVWIEILHPQADTIEPEFFEQLQCGRIDAPRVDLNRKIAPGRVAQPEVLSKSRHQFDEKGFRKVRWRAASPMQLIHDPCTVKVPGAERDLLA